MSLESMFWKKKGTAVTKTATTSIAPESPVELAKNGIKVTIRWRFIASIVSALLGAAGVAGLATMVGVNSTSAEELSTFKADQTTQHTRINDTLEAQDRRAKKQDERIEEVSKVVKSVQSTQLRDVARTEARRLTEKIPNREEREYTYDRLYELNLRRLERGDDPCGTTACD